MNDQTVRNDPASGTFPPFRPNGTIVFLSDFGLQGTYPAEVKGAILSVAPRVVVIDATHAIPPQDVRAGAFWLGRCAHAFPSGTVFLAVVDPGVGTRRKPLVVQYDGGAAVGPDNGVLSWLDQGRDVSSWRIERPDLYRGNPSTTFHGRDVFGPVAAALASGKVSPWDCGPPARDPVVLTWPRSAIEHGRARAEVLVVDPFGNIVLGLPAADLAPPPRDGAEVLVEIAGRTHRAVWGTYMAGEIVVHGDSSGLVEIAVRLGDAASSLNAGPGTEVMLTWV